ncbi:MAG TPA: hypothetical protein VGE67_15150 [Haloferula sp.]
MSARHLPAHPLNRLGVALLVAALACWIGFHFLRFYGDMRGWGLWKEIWQALMRGSMPQWRGMIFISAFLTIALLVSAAPFITLLLRKSKPCRWLAIMASGAALLGLGSIILKDTLEGPALPVLLAAMTLNFIGLICLRAPRLEVGTES